MPTRVVAVNHDTSVAMLKRTYSRYIGDHADALARRAMLDTSGSGREPASKEYQMAVFRHRRCGEGGD